MGWMEDYLAKKNGGQQAVQPQQWMEEYAASRGTQLALPTEDSIQTSNGNSGVVEEIKNTASDLWQAVSNPVLPIGTGTAGVQQVLGGNLQLEAEAAQQRAQFDYMSRPGYQTPDSFAGYPSEEKQKLGAALSAFKKVAQSGVDLYNEGKALDEGLQEAFPQKSYLGNIAHGVTTSIAIQVPTMALSVIMPPLAVPLSSTMYWTTRGQKYGERRNEQGFDVATALEDSQFQGNAEVATEMASSVLLGNFLAAAKAGKAVLKPLVMEMLGEYASESVATALQSGNDFTRANPTESLADYILSRQHLSDQVDTFFATIMQSGTLAVPGKVMQFNAQRRVKNYIAQLDETISELEASGETEISLPDGTVVAVADIKERRNELQKDFGLDVKSQEENALESVDQSVQVEEAEEVLAEPVEVDEQTLLAETRQNLEGLQLEEEATPDEIMQDSEIFEPTVQEEVAEPVAVEQAGDPAFGLAVSNHLNNPIQGDSFVIASPTFQAQANYVEDILIATNTPSRVAIMTVDELRSNPELAPQFGDLVEHMQTSDTAAIQRLGDGRYIVAINPNYNEAQNLEMLTHEAVGHVIAYEQFGKAAPEVQAAIEADYNTFLANHRQSMDDAKAFYPFNWLKTGKIGVDFEYVSILQEGTNVGKEWLANQITKWATTSEKPLTLADKWFKKLAMRLRAALGKLKRKGDTSALAAPSVEAWMNNLFDASRLDSIQTSNANSVPVVEVTGKKELSYNQKVEKLRKIAKAEDLKRFKVGKAIMDYKDESRAEQLRKSIREVTKTGHSSVAVERMKRELKQIEGNYSNAVTIYTTAADGQQIPLKTIKASSRTGAQRAAEYHKLLFAVAKVNLLEKRSNTSKRREYYAKLFATVKDKLMAVADVEGITPEQAWLEFLANPMDRVLGNKIRQAVNRYGYDDMMDRSLNSMEALAKNSPKLFRDMVLYEKRVIPTETQEIVKIEERINAELASTEPAVVEEVKKAKRTIVRKQGAEVTSLQGERNKRHMQKALGPELALVRQEGSDGSLESTVLAVIDYQIRGEELPSALKAEVTDHLKRIDASTNTKRIAEEIQARRIRPLFDGEFSPIDGKFPPQIGYTANGKDFPFDASDTDSVILAGAAVLNELDNPSPVSVQDLNTNSQKAKPVGKTAARDFDQRVIEAAQDAVVRSVMAGDKPNLNRVLSAMSTKLQLTGKDKKAAEEIVRKNWADLSSGKQIKPEQHPLAGISIPEEISDEEAAAFMEMLDGFAAKKTDKDNVTRLVTKPERDFYRSFKEEIQAKAAELQQKIEAYTGWRLSKGDRFRSAKTRKTYEVTGYSWNIQKDIPMYLTKTIGEEEEASSMYAIKHESMKYGTGVHELLDSGEFHILRGPRKIDSFAKKKTPEEVKQQKIKDSLYLQPKAKRKRKELTPEEQAEKETAKLERRSKAERKRRALLEQVIQLAEVAKSKELSLTEYLSAEGFTDEDALKMVRMYYANHGSIFSQKEQIIRLSRELGLYLTAEEMLADPDADVAEGLNDLIKEVFPKSYGTLDTLGIRGKDVILARLQKMYEDQTGESYDFSKEQTLRDYKQAKQKEFEDLSGWQKVKITVNRVVDRVQDVLSVTPAGSKIVWYLKQIQSAQYSLYSRDYMRKIDEMMKEIPDASAREALTEKYLAGEEGSTELERKYLGLMNQIFTSYGMEMERLGFKIYYNSKRQELFKFDPAERYFPRMWPDGAFTKPSEEMIQSLIRSGEAIDEANARKIINKLRRRYNRLHVPRFANMELARETNMDGWIKDPAEVLRRYVASGSRRMAVMRVLGPTAEAKLVSLAAEHLRQSNIPDAMEDAVNAIQAVIGGSVAGATRDTAVTWGVNEAQAFAVMTMLQHSVFLQPGVSANVSAVLGYKNLIKGFSKIMFKDKATREVNKARGFAMGVSERFISKEIYDTIDGENNPARERTDKILRSWRMIGLDQWMRAGTALASEVYLQEEIAKAVGGSAAAKKNLRSAFIDPDKVVEAVETGNEDEVREWIRMGSFTLTQQTNFATDALTMPKILVNAHPVLQMLTLFSRFSYHQHKHIADMFKNNPKRLLRQIPSQLAIGAPIYMLRLLAKGIDPFKEMEEDGVFATLYKMFMSGSGLGLFAESVISAFMGYAGKGGGPVGGTITAGLQNVGQAARAIADPEKDIKEYTYIAAIRGLIDAGIYVTARYAPAPIGIPVAAGAAMVAPAIERNVIPTDSQKKTNWTGG